MRQNAPNPFDRTPVRLEQPPPEGRVQGACPPIPKELIEFLERVYLPILATPDVTMPQAYFNGGQMSVVQSLRRTFENQNRSA